MPTYVNICARALCVGTLTTLSVLGAIEAARADDCLREPPRADPAVRWTYYTDRATNRRCWYRIDPAARAPVASAPEPSPHDPTAPFGAFFSWWNAGPGNPSAPPSDSGDPRAAPGQRLDDPRIDARPRVLRPSSAAAAAITPKPHRPAPAAAPVVHADAQPQARLTPTERDALFRDFLHWQEQQKPQ